MTFIKTSIGNLLGVLIRINKQSPAANERFGASGAVPRPKGSGDFQVLCLVSSSVKAPPAPSRQTLWAMSDDSTVGQFCKVHGGQSAS